MSGKIFETIGTITKKEKLAVVEAETNSNALILEALQPFPGYHGATVPDSLEPESLFAITRLMYNDERIIRTIQSLKKESPVEFDGAPGTLNIQHEDYNFIRFKYLPYANAGEVINQFEKTGIEFKKTRKIVPYESILKVRKFFTLQENIEGIYNDREDNNMFYLEIPVLLRWNTFEKITIEMKYNMEDNNFDAAQSSIYCRKGLMDFVRIYDRDSCQGKLIFIRDKYLEAISRL